MATYTEGDATRVIPLVSDDGGLTWYPKGGDPAQAREASTVIIRLKSADAGTSWTTT